MTAMIDPCPPIPGSMVGHQIHDIRAEVVPLDALRAADSPRLAGQDGDHVRRLAQTEQKLPPIMVHRPSMRVIDGMHRVRAAELRGEREIAVTFFDGDDDAAFLLSVQSNIAHGLPLTLADRTAAAARILRTHPAWSDRAIARLVGLAHATVGAIRRRLSLEPAQAGRRLGRDGRARALNTAQARRIAGELIAREPGASLRKIAQQAGISPATVRDVRMRLSRGDDPVPPKQRRSELAAPEPGPAGPARPSGPRGRGGRRSPAQGGRAWRPMEIWQRLRKDPALRSSETGRALLRWLAVHSSDVDEWRRYMDDLPPHCAILMVDMARGLADVWTAFADDLEQRAEQPR
ncbi:MAG TPA: ParB N-terminal domain-containing protein [Streptosporangiaceae bacterium]